MVVWKDMLTLNILAPNKNVISLNWKAVVVTNNGFFAFIRKEIKFIDYFFAERNECEK